MEDIIEEETVLDIDTCDANNPLAVVDYIEDLYAHYRKLEVHFERIGWIWYIFFWLSGRNHFNFKWDILAEF